MHHLQNLDQWTEAELEASQQAFLGHLNPDDQLWIFGYGSLMWRPDFQSIDCQKGRVLGYHRRFCCWSVFHRGTQDYPGLVLALDQGGCCEGLAYQVQLADADEDLRRLWKREMVTGFYVPRWVTVNLGGRDIEAITFAANPEHPQYATNLTAEQEAHRIGNAHGNSGSNLEYFTNTLLHLEEMNIHEPQLAQIQIFIDSVL